ncbi:MAG: DNA polymerase III subunit delta [Bacteroidales bacterium]|nr:DNA polymerase III subunit delta [Bacteroidales bacterium]
MFFKEIAGQYSIKQKLIKSVKDNRVSHAQLFFGPEGCGSLPLAIAYAQYINCHNPKDDDSCGICPSCIKYSKLAHPDLHFVFPVTTSEKVKKDPVSGHYIAQWREILLNNVYFSENQWYEFIKVENKQGYISVNESNEIIRKLSFKAYEAEYKVMIIWLPERMNPSSANKMLKLLEEPEEKTLFIMVSENTGTILPTILSRLQLIKLLKIDKHDLEKFLTGSHSLSPSEAEDIAGIANGNMVKALSLIVNKETSSYLTKFREFMLSCYKKDLPEIQNWIDDMSGLGREKIKAFLEFCLRIIRENLMVNYQLPEISYLDKSEEEFTSKFSKFINASNVYAIYEEFNNAYNYIESNANNKIIFFDLALKIFNLIKK